ncbi:MAG: DNA integrity scanning protein DisA nucleotide-binding domain protein [Deltaproteobacteria bacterium]|nr:DNA integrity scanning protein DisA nucleotide-binding domain protein [Deltaproteobacteria bacterium]MBW2659935.1 DNA integrity scanning protein DisA nucleotide-binding domain protein [Deltaproteobacteria bacterium]
MAGSSFVNRCISETLGGIRDGLSLFSGASRVAIIFAISGIDDLVMYDPQNLLKGYEPKLKNIYLQDHAWRSGISKNVYSHSYNYIEPQQNLKLDGLISCGGSSSTVFYQMWFTEHHPNLCSTGPTECWLEHAVLRLSHDIANDSSLYTGISGSFLREYALHAVRDYIIDKVNRTFGLDYHIRIYPVLDAVLSISKTNEEGARPFGKLTFVEPRFLDTITYLAHFKGSERPPLNNFKHVRKLLQAVEHSDHTLISDGKSILGIGRNILAEFHITVDFQGKFGFLTAGGEKICSFQDGSYSSNTHRAKLFEVEEALLDFNMETSSRNDLFRIVAKLVHNAGDKIFGCTFVLDLAENPADTAGQSLTPPLDLREREKLTLAGALSKVDGALHIRSDLHLYSFACLLDGHRIKGENRARGARYNSALRFTAQYPETIVVVVSADRPVSIFRGGKEIQSGYSGDESLHCNLFPLPLKEWVQEG